MRYAVLLQFALAIAVVSCASPNQGTTAPSAGAAFSQRHRHALPTPIQHVVIIFQENRTTDYLFNGMLAYGANIATTAVDSSGNVVPLKPISLAAPYDLGHGHKSFVADCDMQPSNTCKMDGFDKDIPAKYHLRPFGYAPQSEVQPYLDMATQYVFADNMFQTNQAGSFPAHQYIYSGDASGEPATADNVSSDPFNSKTGAKTPAGCDAPALSVVDTIDPVTGSPGPTPFPCFDRPVLSDLLNEHAVTWKYYEDGLGAGLWHAPDAIRHIRFGPWYAMVITPPQTILKDISQNRLPGVSWVMPADGQHSDHSGNRSTAGPSWVAAVVNAIGQSSYWNTTAILITWDDWGGWYDHVPPQQFNSYELSFRVPLVIVSPYAKMGASRQGYVSHVQYEFGSILAFAEETFGIAKGSLGATDVRANDLSDAFDFTQNPRPFVVISASPFVPGKGTNLHAEDPDN
jgi:phospholipase C